MLPQFSPVLSPERQVVMWTEPRKSELFTVERFPVFYIHVEEGAFYGFPEYGRPGFKIGKYHHRCEAADPDVPSHEPDEEDERVLRAAVSRYFPDADGPRLAAETCLFTNTPDEHFLIGRQDGVSYAAGSQATASSSAAWWERFWPTSRSMAPRSTTSRCSIRAGLREQIRWALRTTVISFNAMRMDVEIRRSRSSSPCRSVASVIRGFISSSRTLWRPARSALPVLSLRSAPRLARHYAACSRTARSGRASGVGRMRRRRVRTARRARPSPASARVVSCSSSKRKRTV